jgi:hypothetical protein
VLVFVLQPLAMRRRSLELFWQVRPCGRSVWRAAAAPPVFRPLPLLMACMLLVFYVDGFLVGAPIPLALGLPWWGLCITPTMDRWARSV